MTAKEYLSKLRIYEQSANNKQKQYELIRKSIRYLESIRRDEEELGTMPQGTLSDSITKLKDSEKEVVAEIERYINLYNDGVEKINSLSRPEYVEILTRRYLENDHIKRKLEWIAVDLQFSYDRIRHMHTEALQEFSRRFL